MERKLASIQRIITVEPIENADRVEKATVLGWQLIVEKGQFHPGDSCIFFEIDSILPEQEWSEFLRPKKFRIKTMKSHRLGVLSQGLALPLSILPSNKYLEGDDVTEILGVKKWEPPLEAGKNTIPKGVFPTHIVPKTNEIRIQSIPQLFDEIRGLKYITTIKLDGTSFTSYYFNSEFGVCSRNFELEETVHDIYWNMARKYKLKERLSKYCIEHNVNIAIQGEICGSKIQNNPLKLRVDELFIFSIFNINTRKYFDYAEMQDIIKELKLQSVPIDHVGINFHYTLKELLELARGCYEGTDNPREGIVIRPMNYKYSPTLGNQLSFKIINNDYLLKDNK